MDLVSGRGSVKAVRCFSTNFEYLGKSPLAASSRAKRGDLGLQVLEKTRLPRRLAVGGTLRMTNPGLFNEIMKF